MPIGWGLKRFKKLIFIVINKLSRFRLVIFCPIFGAVRADKFRTDKFISKFPQNFRFIGIEAKDYQAPDFISQ